MRRFFLLSCLLCCRLISTAQADEPKLELAVQTGHTTGTSSLAFSPNSERIIWDARTGHKLHTLAGHDRWDVPVAVSPDGRLVVTGALDGWVGIWDTATGKQLRKFQAHSRGVYALVFGPGGKWIASGSSDQTVVISEVSTGKKLHTLQGFKDWVTGGHDRAAAVHPGQAVDVDGQHGEVASLHAGQRSLPRQ